MSANVVDGSYIVRNLGTSASPAAQSVDVPASALAVVVHVAASSDGATPVNVTGLSGNFCGTFTRVDEAGSLVAAYGCVGYAKVNSTGTGKTITVTFGGANTLAGATAIIYFLDTIDPDNFVVGTPDTARTADGTSAATATVTTVADLVIAMDSRFDTSNANTYPADETDYTSLTTAQSSNTYQLNSRLRRVTTPAAGTDTATTQTTYGSLVSLISFRGNQSLTPSLFTKTKTFYSPTATRGTVTLSPNLVSKSKQFYSPSILSSYSLLPGLFTKSKTFYSPAVSAGEITLLPNLLSNSKIFYSPTVSLASGTQNLFPSLVTKTKTFYRAIVSSEYSLTPSLFTHTKEFFSPSINSEYTLAPALVEKTKTFYSPTVNSEYSIVPGLVTHDKVFYGPTVSLQSDTTLYPDLFTHTKTIYGPTVVTGGLNTAKLYVDLFTGNLLYLKGLN